MRDFVIESHFDGLADDERSQGAAADLIVELLSHLVCVTVLKVLQHDGFESLQELLVVVQVVLIVHNLLELDIVQVLVVVEVRIVVIERFVFLEQLAADLAPISTTAARLFG